MRVLVLGGSNLIGPPTIRRLVARGHAVAAFNRGRTAAELPPGVTRLRGERDALPAHRAAFARFAPDVVLHGICYTGPQAQAAVEVFSGIAERMVMLSSCDVYRAFGRLLGTEPDSDGPPGPLPIDEEAPLRAKLFPYGEAVREPGYDKIPAERIVSAARALPTTILRLPMIYGPRDHRHRIHGYARRMADGRRFILLDEAVARWRPCRAYVEDVAHAIALAVEQGGPRIYNVGDPHDLSEKAWVEAIGAAYGWSGRVEVLPAAAMPAHLRFEDDARHHLTLDTTRIREELGYTERAPLDDALRATLEWTLAHPPTGEMAPALDYPAEDAALER